MGDLDHLINSNSVKSSAVQIPLSEVLIILNLISLILDLFIFFIELINNILSFRRSMDKIKSQNVPLLNALRNLSIPESNSTRKVTFSEFYGISIWSFQRLEL